MPPPLAVKKPVSPTKPRPKSSNLEKLKKRLEKDQSILDNRVKCRKCGKEYLKKKADEKCPGCAMNSLLTSCKEKYSVKGADGKMSIKTCGNRYDPTTEKCAKCVSRITK